MSGRAETRMNSGQPHRRRTPASLSLPASLVLNVKLGRAFDNAKPGRRHPHRRDIAAAALMLAVGGWQWHKSE